MQQTNRNSSSSSSSSGGDQHEPKRAVAAVAYLGVYLRGRASPSYTITFALNSNCPTLKTAGTMGHTACHATENKLGQGFCVRNGCVRSRETKLRRAGRQAEEKRCMHA
mmetsp:Transcript_19756/g.55133  ORF Transcript_19756/g.55133 Transcript_19756/m.55133 type:complete len:109 (+) Transcript_19756:211-537(+)